MKQNNFFKKLFAFFRGTSLFVNLGVAVWLSLCMIAAFYDVSQRPSYISFFSFSNVFAVFANITFVVFWIFTSKKKYSILSIVCLIACWPITKSSFGFNFFSSETKGKEDISLKIMTWNVHLFDLGEWTRNKQAKNKILDFIREQDPDILCMQEFYFDDENRNEPYVNLLREMGYGYYEFTKEGDSYKRSLNLEAKPNEIITIGNAVFSKFPLSNFTRYDEIDTKTKYYNVLGVDVKLATDKSIRLFTTHLQSTSLKDSEVEFAEEKTGKLSTQVDIETKGILSKIMHASSKRAKQANTIDSILSRSSLPTVICGDFNDMPGSYVYHKIKGKQSDAFSDKGIGLGRTYSKIFPTLRIDYIFYDNSFLKCNAYYAPNIHLSDHKPVIATFSLKSPTVK